MNVKVGDKIRMICDDELFGDFHVGDTAVIVDVNPYPDLVLPGVEHAQVVWDDEEAMRCAVDILFAEEFEVIQ